MSTYNMAIITFVCNITSVITISFKNVTHDSDKASAKSQ